MYRMDNVILALQLAEEAGHPLCWPCLLEDNTEAGTLDRPDRRIHDLLPRHIALVDLLLNDVALCDVLVVIGKLKPAVAAMRLRALAKLVATVMPAVVEDQDGRFGVGLNGEDRLPSTFWYEREVTLAAQAVRSYVDDHDRGEWVDPYVMAGAVADLHDALRDLVALNDVTPVLTGGAA
jgi:hypothetical protein